MNENGNEYYRGKELLVFSLLVEISILCCRQVENFCLFLNTAEAMCLNWKGIQLQVDFCIRRNPKTSVLLLCRTNSLFLNMHMIQLKQLNLSMFWHSSRFLPLLQSVACQTPPSYTGQSQSSGQLGSTLDQTENI